MDLYKRFGKWCVSTCLILLSYGVGLTTAQAIILNYSASINQGTCQISLDKTALHLGTVEMSAMRGSTLVSAQSFTLQIRSCGDYQAGLTPAIKITGEGMTRDGKWLFRSSADSVSQGFGIVLAKSDTIPLYNQASITNGDYLNLTATTDTDVTFFAGIACGSATNCQDANMRPGRVSARIVFDFVYR
ncbi:Uncharacterised protein [Pragia fontium]|uniref:fimbrial protein n=1 Tax=Pragia fontium TaxID=82985 RepID=UPI000E0415EC|nr:fimbrial protein [Pragia fontium]SUB82575.1 Uncharacterised protein [Pragia fontium]